MRRSSSTNSRCRPRSSSAPSIGSGSPSPCSQNARAPRHALVNEINAIPSEGRGNFGLKILGILIVVFAVPYLVALCLKNSAGIWVVWPEDRVQKDIGCSQPSRATWRFFLPQLRYVWVRVIAAALYFSLLSTFQIGWRELNLGNWIARLQSREYVLKPTGWVRVVAGIQSLVSVYLVALWALTYFGRPFE